MEKEAINKAISELVGKQMDFFSDLNAMHEAEMIAVNGVEFDEGVYIERIEMIHGRCGYAVFATASKRAQAFVQNIGKWDDSK